jgi:P-type E1-E2 ATPase
LELKVTVLTGDGGPRGERVAGELGVSVTANLLPEDKARQVLDLRRKFGCVAMVGDGINDAPALAAADTGVAMGCGTDFTRDSADVCLLDDDLRRFPWAVSLARKTVRTIRQNLFWAFGYNSFGVALAAAGWLHPAIAAVLMLLSSVFVIFNSLRLSRFDLGQGANDSAGASPALAATAPFIPGRLGAAATVEQMGRAQP